MAIKCANCGQELPRDDAKFCNSCGAPIVLPSWMRQGRHKAQVHEGLKRAPLRSAEAPYIQDRGAPPNRPPLNKGTPQREMRSKVWESKESDIPTLSEEDTIFPDDVNVFPEDSLEDLPTSQMETTLPGPPVRRSAGTTPASSTWNPDDITQRRTSHLQSQRQGKPEEPLSQPGASPGQSQGTGQAQADTSAMGPINRPLQGSRPMQPEGVVFQKPPQTPQLRPGAGQAQGAVPTGSRPMQPGFVPPTPVGAQFQAPPSVQLKPLSRQGMSGRRLMLVLALLLVLVVGGIAAWLVAAKPFAVASITQPWQQFCASGVGVAGQYPTGWTKQVDSTKAVHFTDGTDQFSVVSVEALGQDAATYLKQEASQLKITGLKLGTPVSFAGTVWQEAQGSILSSQTGVTYTEALFVAMHGNHLFTVMQIAPPGTYREEDATIFSGMRSFFQFSNRCP